MGNTKKECRSLRAAVTKEFRCETIYRLRPDNHKIIRLHKAVDVCQT